MEVRQLKQSELTQAPTSVTRLIPNYCPYCGKPLVINLALTGLSCSDEFCVSKIANRCVSFLKQLGFLGLGESAMLDFCDHFNITSPVMLFLLEESDIVEDDYYDPNSAIYNQLLDLVSFLSQHNELELAKYIELAQMPGIQTATATALAKPFSSVAEMLSTIEVSGIDYVQELLGIDPNTTSLKSVAVYDTLMLNYDNLLAPIEQNMVTIKAVRTDLPELITVISESAGGTWKSKKDFIDFVTTRFKDEYRFNFKNGVTKSTVIVIAPEGANTSKVRKAQDYDIPVVSGDQFIDLLTQTDNINDLVNTALV